MDLASRGGVSGQKWNLNEGLSVGQGDERVRLKFKTQIKHLFFFLLERYKMQFNEIITDS